MSRPRSLSLLPLLWSAALTAQQATPSATAEPILRADKQVELRFHPGGLEAPLAAALADGAWAVVVECQAQWKALGLRPKAAMTVNVWADADAYRAVVTASGVRFLVQELADATRSRADIALQPVLKVELLAEIGLPKATRAAIVRQLTWLAAAQTELGARDPLLCRVVAAGALDRLDPAAVPGAAPAFDGRRRVARCSLLRGNKPNMGYYLDLLVEPVDMDEWDRQWEAAAWYAQVLAGKSKSWAKSLLTPNAAAKKASGIEMVRRAQLAGPFGGSMEKFRAALDELTATPFGGWASVFPEVSTINGRVRLVGAEVVPARVTYDGRLPSGPFAIRGEVEIAPVGLAEWRCEFFQGERALAAIFENSACFLSQWDGKRWTRLKKVDLPARSTRYQVSVEVADELRVVIDGEQVLSAPYGDFPMREMFGLSCNDSIVWLHDLRIERL